VTVRSRAPVRPADDRGRQAKSLIKRSGAVSAVTDPSFALGADPGFAGVLAHGSETKPVSTAGGSLDPFPGGTKRPGR
jgi:hypothetical protein